MQLFATAAKGTEGALRDELRELRLRGVRADRGGVHFEGELEDGARACLWSRVAMRVLLAVGSFDAPSERALYEGVRGVDWSAYVDARRTLAVKASCKSSALTHTQYIAQKTKDAIVDQLRDRSGARPSVDLRDPDLLVTVHLVKDRAQVYVDLAGEPLHRRGYRTRAGAAPIKETLAAACVRLSGWDRESPFVDPMCGAGTIAIEAAAWAQRVAPGLGRERFGLERWACFDETARRGMAALREEARAAALPAGPEVIGSDVDAALLELARANARDAGVRVRFDGKDVRDISPHAPRGWIVTNPPYGERIAATKALHEEMGRALARMKGWTVSVLAGAPEIAAAVPMKADRWIALWNGAIECRLLTYEVR